MSAALIVIIIVLAFVVVLGVVAISMYNGFVKQRNLIQESWRQVDVELNRRYELIPNLVETVRGYAAHERNTLEDVTRLRNQAAQVASREGDMPSAQRAQSEEALSGAVRNLLVSVEAYPDLKSNQNFLQLQRELTDTEDRIAAGRRYYNANVRDYNTKIDSVPTNVIASMFKFEKATYFEVNEAARQSPDVNFGSIAYRGDEKQAPAQAPQSQDHQSQAHQSQAHQSQAPALGSQSSQQPYGQQDQFPQQQNLSPQQQDHSPQEQGQFVQQPPQQSQTPPNPGGYQAPGEWKQS